jgi:hypothetical protein
MSTSESKSEHLSTVDTLFELTAQLELLTHNTAIETNTHAEIAGVADVGGNNAGHEKASSASLQFLLQEVRETLHWACSADEGDPAPGEGLSRLAERLAQTVCDLESPRVH